MKIGCKSTWGTKAITIALKDWVDIYTIKKLNKKITQKAICINSGQRIREMNRSD